MNNHVISRNIRHIDSKSPRLYKYLLIYKKFSKPGIYLIKTLYDLDSSIFKKIIELYKNNKYIHAYLIYDLIYEYDNIDLYIDINGSEINSYILLRRGYNSDLVIIWSRDCSSVLFNLIDSKFINELRSNSIIELLINEECIDHVLKQISRSGKYFETSYFYIMSVDQNNFKPYYVENIRKLTLNDLIEFIEIKRLQRREYSYRYDIDFNEATYLLRKFRYYGLFIDNKLVSIGCRYIDLPDVSIIGDIFTRSEYRGRGYGKALTSTITRDVINYGAESVLHVDVDNQVAIRVYEKIGYKIIGKYLWLFNE